MTHDLKYILIFKTNIKKENDKAKIKNVLEAFPEIHEWNVDSDDVDCVLRIVSPSLTPQQIISEINHHGFYCEELAD